MPLNIKKNISFAPLKNIVLIGGGDLMVASTKVLKSLGFELTIITATRHINEKLVLSDETLAQACQQLTNTPHVLDDINQLNKQQLLAIIPDNAIAICFGPAWVFSEKIIQQFHYGMFNINAIPIPHYLGGAHYTWQLLNNNQEGGCFFQKITDKLDQGDIFAKHQFIISSEARTPHDYFVENVQQGTYFINELANMFIEGKEFIPTSYKALDENRLYFPRLRTDKQAYINWQWTAQEIVTFCQGFDSPYMGAASFIQKSILRLKKIKLITLADNNNNQISAMHPFCAGLIIRKIKKMNSTSIVIAAINGFVELREVYDNEGCCMMEKLKEGMRLHTPQHVLDDAMAYQVTIDGQGFKD